MRIKKKKKKKGKRKKLMKSISIFLIEKKKKYKTMESKLNDIMEDQEMIILNYDFKWIIN